MRVRKILGTNVENEFLDILGCSKPVYFFAGTIVRQLARVNAVSYRETLWSELFPGNQLTMQCLQQAGQAGYALLLAEQLSQ